MSETTREMLVRGIAAAKTNRPEDKAEAHRYLEWVLRSDDATFEQKANAWLWLSQVEDDAAKKRECLENVLAIDPANALARRGLAILDGRIQPDEVIDHRQPIEPIAPPAAGVRRFVCPKCGGAMTYHAKERAVTCGYCGHHLTEFQALTQGAVVHEQDFSAALPTAKAHRWELATQRAINCHSCGATFALLPQQISGACPFCGSPHVIEAMPTGELIQPDGLVPFQFDADAARVHLRKWIDSQKFRPNDLDERAALARPRGVYLPFWTFDLGGQINWSAQIEVRHGRYSTWEPRNDIYLVYHNDLLVPASHSLPKTLIDQLTDFDTKALTPYSIDLLSDWPAEIYQIALADASLVARERALHIARHHVERQSLAGEQYRDLTLNSTGMIVETYKLVLLPMWLTSYRYKDRSYAAAVNGQTGVAAGDVPRGGLQKLLVGLFGEE